MVIFSLEGVTILHMIKSLKMENNSFVKFFPIFFENIFVIGLEIGTCYEIQDREKIFSGKNIE